MVGVVNALVSWEQGDLMVGVVNALVSWNRGI